MGEAKRKRGMNPRGKKQGVPNRLFHAIIAETILLALLFVILYLRFGTAPVIGQAPWFIVMMQSFAGLAAFSVGFLALGRHRVLREPVSYWIGIGFTSFGVLSIFLVLSWPGLLSGTRGLIAYLPNTSAWMLVWELSTLGSILVAANLLRWPGERALAGGRWLGSVAGWLGGITLIASLTAVLERYLPALVEPRGHLTALMLSLNWAFLSLFTAGTILSTRQFRLTGNTLLGYVAISQVAVAFVVIAALIGQERYDVWYYSSQVLQVVGFLAMLFGLLSEYVQLFRREREKTVEAQQAEEALQTQKRDLARAQAAAHLGSWRWDLEHDTITWSEELYRIVGVDPQRFAPSNEAIPQVIHPDDRPRYTQFVATALTGQTVPPFELRIIRPNGEERVVLSSGLEVEFDAGRPILLFGTVLDITERKEVEREREQLLARTRRDAEARAELLREVNHRVKNNLVAITSLLYAQMEKPEIKDEPRLQNAIEEVARRVEGLAVVHRMLSASEWTPLRLDELAQQLIHAGLQAVPPGKVDVHVWPAPMRVSPDQAHTLALVLNELTTNVIKYAVPKRERVDLVVEAKSEAGEAVLTFHDNGPGYPESVLAQKRAPSGIGLGLVENLVRRNLRGQLILHNEQGATAELHFPLTEAAEEEDVPS